MNQVTMLRWLLRLIGFLALIGIGKYTNWQTAVLLFLLLWSNNADQRDTTIRETVRLIRNFRNQL